MIHPSLNNVLFKRNIPQRKINLKIVVKFYSDAM